MTTCSATKASAPYKFVIGSPSASLFATLSLTPCTAFPGSVFAPSQSDISIPHVPCKRKVVVPDTSTTSSEKPSTFSLIENVDMRELIEDLIKTKLPPPAYHCIQEFLTKICIPFFSFLHSFHRYQYFIFHLHFSKVLHCKLERGVFNPTPSQRFTHALTYSLQTCPRTCGCRGSRPPP